MNRSRLALAAVIFAATALPSQGAFHFMEIEQIVGGLSGNASAQAIQLQLRNTGQNVLISTRLVARDSAGNNPVVLFDFTANGPSALNASRILIASPAFLTLMTGVLATDGVTAFSSDYTMAAVIPPSYLAGGKVTFENDTGTSVIWSIAFGNYAGTNLGTTENDNDGNFGTPFASALPTNSRGLLYRTLADVPGAGNKHTINSTEYALTSGNATVVNSAAKSFTVVPEPGIAALLGAFGLSVFAIARRRG